jgi:hypothetical protein
MHASVSSPLSHEAVYRRKGTFLIYVVVRQLNNIYEDTKTRLMFPGWAMQEQVDWM